MSVLLSRPTPACDANCKITDVTNYNIILVSLEFNILFSIHFDDAMEGVFTIF